MQLICTSALPRNGATSRIVNRGDWSIALISLVLSNETSRAWLALSSLSPSRMPLGECFCAFSSTRRKEPVNEPSRLTREGRAGNALSAARSKPRLFLSVYTAAKAVAWFSTGTMPQRESFMLAR